MPAAARLPTLGRTVCAALLASGCAGASPLLHPAHTLPAGNVTVGAGVTGTVGALQATEVSNDNTSEVVLEDFAVAPGVGPWAAGRVGIPGDNEAGITYAGRSFRADIRHAFPIGPLKLSLGVGGSALIPRERTGGEDLGNVYGGGGDVPLIIGWVSDAELYSVWFGPRGGFEILGGSIVESEYLPGGRADLKVPFSGKHFFVGGLLGAKVGFRTFHVALEVGVTYHFADGTFGEEGGGTSGEQSVIEASLEQLTVVPAGALLLTF